MRCLLVVSKANRRTHTIEFRSRHGPRSRQTTLGVADITKSWHGLDDLRSNILDATGCLFASPIQSLARSNAPLKPSTRSQGAAPASQSGRGSFWKPAPAKRRGSRLETLASCPRRPPSSIAPPNETSKKPTKLNMRPSGIQLPWGKFSPVVYPPFDKLVMPARRQSTTP